MIIFPAIDIRGGNAVRLTQGDYDQEKVYHTDPVAVAKEWEAQGAEYIHIVDLDGAKSGESANGEAIRRIAQNVNIPIQVGGGVRSMEDVTRHIQNGVRRVIIGTAAIENPSFVQEAVKQYGDQIAVSIDARNGYVATDGWTSTSDTKATTLIQQLESFGVQTIVYTDILKDGMMQGPNFEEVKEVNESTTIDVIASGGVSTEENVQSLQEMNMYGAIIGKALYEGDISLERLMKESFK